MYRFDRFQRCCLHSQIFVQCLVLATSWSGLSFNWHPPVIQIRKKYNLWKEDKKEQFKNWGEFNVGEFFMGEFIRAFINVG